MTEDYNLPQDISKVDPENYKHDILEVPAQAEQGYKLAEAVDLSSLQREQYTNVIVTGMGGSAIAALLMKNFLYDDKLKLHVNQDYFLPKWADSKTLVIACSYSGNTEETLSAFKDARRNNCAILCVTVGGKLEEYAKVSRIPTVILPANYQPRAAVAIQFFAMLRLLERLRLIQSRGIDISKFREELKTQLPMLEKSAIALSEKIAGKIPIIYSSNRFSAVSYRWKCQFNENSKEPAFCHVFSELNHNELAGFSNVNGNFHLIFLRFEDDHRRVQQRMNLTKEVLLRKGISSTDIGIRGSNVLTKMFSTILLGDLTSYYLALRLKTNPSKVEIIEDFKRNLGPFVG
jgi:glucose/mannose-6-phosphate isomerase